MAIDDTLTMLADDDWTAQDFRAALFARPIAPGLVALNSHFTHYSFFPNDPADVYATEVTPATDYRQHPGLQHGLSLRPQHARRGAGQCSPIATDWAQAFTRRGATYLGNTGYGYGDADLLAYSERLMTNFVGELGDWSPGRQTVGARSCRPSRATYNTLAAGSFSRYDEKVLGELTLYGLPMLRVNLPVTTTAPYGGPNLVQARTLSGEGFQAQAATTASTTNVACTSITPSTQRPTAHITPSPGSQDAQATGNRPVQPRASLDVARTR